VSTHLVPKNLTGVEAHLVTLDCTLADIFDDMADALKAAGHGEGMHRAMRLSENLRKAVATLIDPSKPARKMR
jgi:hypothetical protein